MAKQDPITWKGSTDNPAEAYNIANIDTSWAENLETASNIATGMVDTAWTVNTPPTDWIPGWADLYKMSREDIIQKKYDIWSQYANIVSSFDKWDIVDKMRLKTWWVADLDSAIENLKVDMNKSRPALMERYANVIDPRRREALISAEESNIAKQINDLSAIRKFRLGTIKDMTTAEIASQENKLKGLEAQFNLYQNVLWDIDKAEKAKNDMEKTALDIQKKQIELKWLEDKYWLEFKPWKTTYGSTDITDLASKYPNNASFKNNNPGNIKYNNQWANTLAKYGIEITKGTGALDWGNFAKYNSVEDALVWRNILLFKTSTYPNMTVEDAMRRYSNNWYGAEISTVPGNKLMKDLTTAERSKLITGQLKWEDQQMYRELLKRWIDPSRIEIPGEYVKTKPSEAEKKAEEKKKTAKFDDYIRDERLNIVEWLKWDKVWDVRATLWRLYPGEKDPYLTIGRTLNDTEREEIMKNVWDQAWITDDSDDLWKLNDIIKEYASLFYPDEKFADIEYQLWQDFLDLMDIWSTEWFFDIRQNLREKFNDQFED